MTFYAQLMTCEKIIVYKLLKAEVTVVLTLHISDISEPASAWSNKKSIMASISDNLIKVNGI